MFEKSVESLASGHSLADTRVVTRLVGQFMGEVATSGSVTALLATVNRYADIFAGLDDSYEPLEGWNGRELAASMARHLSVSTEQATIDILRAGFGVLGRDVLELVKDADEQSEAESEAAVIELRDFAVSILMGTADTLHPAESEGE